MNTAKVQQQLCEQLCRSIRLYERDDGVVMVENPFTFPDGDSFSLYLSPIADGKYKLSDLANVAMRLSYDDNVDKYFDEKRVQGKHLRQILRETGVRENGGEFYVESTEATLAADIIRISQALTQIFDLEMLSRERSDNTFYDDLHKVITSLLDPSFITRDHYFPCDERQEYKTDYYLRNPQNGSKPLCAYGIPNRDKAQLVTIVLQYLQKNGEDHDSLLIFQDQGNIPAPVLGRLSNAGGDQIASLGAQDDIERKIKRRLINGSAPPANNGNTA